MKEYQNSEVLNNLYWNERLSQIVIANGLNASEDSIRKWMHIFDIPIRQRERTDISKELLENLYWKNKLSVEKIARLLNAGYNTVRRKLKKYNIKTRSAIESNTKYIKLHFTGDLKEKAYILGFRTGDLSAIKKGKCILVNSSTTHPAQVNLFKSIFEKFSKVGIYDGINKRDGRKIWITYCILDKSFKFLLKKKQKIPQWVLNNTNCFYSFLAGYADAEGCWLIYRKNYGNEHYSKNVKVRFQILSGDRIILRQFFKKLKENGFCPKFRLGCKKGYNKSNKNLYFLVLDYQKNVHRLAKILIDYSLHQEKIWRLKFIINNLGKNWDEVKNNIDAFKKWVKETNINSSTQQLPYLPRAMIGDNEYSA